MKVVQYLYFEHTVKLIGDRHPIRYYTSTLQLAICIQDLFEINAPVCINIKNVYVH